MERFKALEEVLQPDSRSEAFAKIDPVTCEVLSMRLDDYHRRLSEISLKEQVPEDVRSYFETVKNVSLYGWFVYPFFTVSVFLSFTAIEMALRKKFGEDDPHRRWWGLKQLLEEAKHRGLISDQGFPSVQARQGGEAAVDDELGLPFGRQVADYTSILIESLPYLRNSFAHPSSQMILVPGEATSSLRISAELINQLF